MSLEVRSVPGHSLADSSGGGKQFRFLPALGAPTVPVVFLVVHALLGVAMAQSRIVVLGHVAAVAAIALWVILTSKRLDHLVYLSGYVLCVDLLWRLTAAPVPYDSGKYMLLVIMMTTLIRFVRQPRRLVAPVLFVAALMPSTVMVLFTNPPTWSRELLSQALMGPLLLGIAVIAFRQLVLSSDEMLNLLWFTLGPILALSMVALTRTLEAGVIQFTNRSNYTTSGGFGPVQMSTVLGFGAVVCGLLFLAKLPIRTRIFCFLLGVGLLAQSIFTFSRGGLYSAVIALAAVTIVAMTASSTRSRMLRLLVVWGLALFMIFGWMNGLTDGKLGLRFENRDSTNRAQLATADFNLFLENPLFGVGVGKARTERVTVGLRESNSHTEVTRLLAEHGIFGVLALVALGAIAIEASRSAQPGWNRMMAVGFVTWSLVSTSHTAMTTALVPMVFALGTIRVRDDIQPGDLVARS